MSGRLLPPSPVCHLQVLQFYRNQEQDMGGKVSVLERRLSYGHIQNEITPYSFSPHSLVDMFICTFYVMGVMI